MSAGMSLKSKKRPSLFQIGPSVNVKPVASFSTCACESTSSWSFSDLTSTAISAPLCAIEAGRTLDGFGPRRRLGRGGVGFCPLRFLDMYASLRVAQETAVAAGARGEDLAENRQSRLGQSIRADVEPRRP